MKKLLIAACAVSAIAASPAMANEGRVEARGGIAFGGGAEEAFAGVGAGYDFDLGESAFVGVDLGADKVLAGGAEVLWSVGVRGGVKVSEKGKLYALGGVGFSDGFEEAYLGAGYQQKLTDSIYGKVEYRRVLLDGTDVNFAGVGVGVAF
ncbi:outer membrane protein [Sphingorhabdus arenilitoris]|uniref:Outer membrane protein n=1 Tax=Sphingorhabdus arenilitoris TaxID=1490041 RepID=A0ABV8RI68_9SPHN